MFLHGLGCDGTMWDAVIERLPAGVGFLVPDLRGHGDSTLGWQSPSVDLWAQDVAALIAHEGLERPAVAGLSMGGYAALALAAGFPDLARAFAFVSTSAGPDDDDGRLRRAQGLAVLRRSGWKAFATGLLPVLLSDALPGFEDRAGRLVETFERAGEAGLAATLFALANRPDRRTILPALGVPSVAIVGDADRLTPPDRAREIASAAPGCRLVILPGIAHMSAMEAPEAVAAALAGL